MLNRIFRRPRLHTEPAGSVPAGLRVYAVGDIHGRLDLLDALISKIDADDAAKDPASTVLVFLGDVIDRGPDSAGVVDRLIRLRRDRPSTRFLLGNHEEIFLAAMRGSSQAIRSYCRVGGRETLLSYGVAPLDYERMDYDEVGAALSRLVPQEHVQFIAGFENMVVLGDYAFVHAGVDHAVPIAEQKPRTLRWIREPFLTYRGNFEKIIVHGHTISHQVEWRCNRIGIDTGAYETGTLSAVCLEGEDRSILQT